jgi:hypothetical protein
MYNTKTLPAHVEMGIKPRQIKCSIYTTSKQISKLSHIDRESRSENRTAIAERIDAQARRVQRHVLDARVLRVGHLAGDKGHKTELDRLRGRDQHGIV